MRSPTASAIGGRASRLAIAWSSCRPPWLLTTIAGMPSSAAVTASSGVITPLSTMGSR